MNSRKREALTMGPWGAPVLTGYPCEDFPSRTTRSGLLLQKVEIKANI